MLLEAWELRKGIKTKSQPGLQGIIAHGSFGCRFRSGFAQTPRLGRRTYVTCGTLRCRCVRLRAVVRGLESDVSRLAIPRLAVSTRLNARHSRVRERPRLGRPASLPRPLVPAALAAAGLAIAVARASVRGRAPQVLRRAASSTSAQRAACLNSRNSAKFSQAASSIMFIQRASIREGPRPRAAVNCCARVT